ncbi:ABC transporter substrate-binding protein [Microlunatus soli]|uniref:Sorbitol/mannitol transport system substrate-binding protein n=1 Tax=Microlunatus soli TaxID=630515 RepID=A0A1H1XZ36_9ACTN|nr:sugar ABC transporter substrate-binding protein [Microlunatus soli]SDT14199.1 sorbitol/mannitol transport system substrate-binding protein [Microlunatus soli]
MITRRPNGRRIPRPPRRRPGVLAVAIALCLALSVSGCAGFGNLGNKPGVTTITLASVNNPQMQDLAQLLPEFNRTHPNIRVNVIMMEENDLRNATTKDVATRGGQYDVMTVGAYEVPIWAKNKWLTDITDRTTADSSYDVEDFFPPVRASSTYNDRLYAAPFYGESSFLMYRKDLFEKAGLTMPDHPTWQQVADLAAKVKKPADDRAGICLRGKPGWGEMFAPLTTVVNTFGGQWFNTNWDAQVDKPGFTDGVQFYVDTILKSGERDPASFGFTECLNLFQQGRAAMWYDATSAAGTLEADGSPVAGKVGYVAAPTDKTEEAGWLWSWNLAINAESQHKDAAWEFVKWATSKDYQQLVADKFGWTRVPPGTRQSLYENPQYKKASSAFAGITAETLSKVNPTQPGLEPQPWTGIQFVGIPEFQDVGNQTSQEIADALAGRQTVDEALAKGQDIAQIAGDVQKREATR